MILYNHTQTHAGEDKFLSQVSHNQQVQDLIFTHDKRVVVVSVVRLGHALLSLTDL